MKEPVLAGDHALSHLEELHRGAVSLILRGISAAHGPVVIKTTRDPRPSTELVTRYRRELELARHTDSAAIGAPIDLVQHNGRPALLIPDVGGTSLDRVDGLQQVPLSERLELATAVASAITTLHGQGLIHKDINPSNIVWVRETGHVQLIDLGIATLLERETPEARPPEHLEGTLPYLAPEQTGRVDHPIDRRADLYALGATLYELFSGHPPFGAHAPLELVHAHIARTPKPLHLAAEGVSLLLSRIVQRLLEKSPDARYQTALGAQRDLEACLALEGADGAGIALGTKDRDPDLRVPRKLYGRRSELQRLEQAFQVSSSGPRQAMFLAGEAGVGKTALVQALRSTVALRRGVFLQGKFGQLRMGKPYAAFGAALGGLVRRLLSGSDDDVAHWRERYLASFGSVASALVDVVPELPLLLGELAPLHELPAAERENVFHQAFRALVRVHADASHPVLLFLDDLQWADLPSLRLLERLATDEETAHVLLLGAWRSEEVDESHPLIATLQRVREAGHEAEVIHLGPVEHAHVVELLVDTLHRDDADAEVEALASVIMDKTAGNPFFLTRFVESLGRRGLLTPTKGGSGWSWDLEQIASTPHTHNVVAFLAGRIEDLSPLARRALQGAAAIGTEFDLRTLAALMETSPGEAQEALAAAVTAELVQPRGKGWLVGATGDEYPDDAYRYRFVHDRVQQAAYATSTSVPLGSVHARLAEIALADGTPGEPGDWLFVAVNHLNQARQHKGEDGTDLSLAAHNLAASRHARRAAAFGSSFSYTEAGLGCLDAAAWTADYPLALALHLEGAEAAYLSTDMQRMVELLTLVDARATSVLDKVRAARVRMDADIANQELLSAISTARDALALLGHDLPAHPDEAQVGAAVGRAMAAVGEQDPRTLSALPDATDPKIRAVMDVLVQTCTPAYYAVPSLLPVCACELVAMSVEHGLTSASPFAFAVYGIVLNSIGMMPAAHAFGELAEELVPRWPERRFEARVQHVVNNLVCVWIDPFHDHIGPLLEAHRIGRDTGDLEYAAVAAHCYVHNALYAGRELPQLEKEAHAFTTFMRNHQQRPMLMAHLPITMTIMSLVGRGHGDPSTLNGPDFDEDAASAEAVALGHRSAIFIIALQKMILRYTFGRVADAHALAQQAWEYQDGVPSTYHLPVFHMFAALAAFATVRDSGPDEAVLARADESVEQIRAWAEAGPVNHAHRLQLLLAERAWALGNDEEAAAAFRTAISLAEASDFRNDRALLLERAALFHLNRNAYDKLVGRALLREARAAYSHWGALAKVHAMDNAHPAHLVQASSAMHSTLGRTTTGSLDVDAAAVVQAARTLSAELELDSLLTRLFTLAMQAAGAERGVLALPSDGVWRIAVHGSAGDPPTVEPIAFDDADRERWPLSALHYAVRTGGALVLVDAMAVDSPFRDDEAIVAHRTQSLLLAPLHRKGTLRAVLVLEHSKIRGVFTDARVEMLQVLMSQAAVSLDNAQLFEAEVARTRAQRRFVPYEFIHALGHDRISQVASGDFVDKELSVLFADLRAFTKLAESLGAEAIMTILNEHFGMMEAPIYRHGGFIDSFIGDEILALFDGEPLKAVRAGVAMQRALSAYSREAARIGDPERPPLRMGVGVNTGPLLLGTVGGKNRFQCSVVGDAVNLASRVQSLTRTYGAPMLIAQSTYEALPDDHGLSLRLVDRAAVKGRQEAIRLYEVLDAEEDAHRERKESALPFLAAGFEAYEARNFAVAMAEFAQAMAAAPEDAVPASLFDRSRRYLVEPPPPDWNGAERLTHK